MYSKVVVFLTIDQKAVLLGVTEVMKIRWPIWLLLFFTLFYLCFYWVSFSITSCFCSFCTCLITLNLQTFLKPVHTVPLLLAMSKLMLRYCSYSLSAFLFSSWAQHTRSYDLWPRKYKLCHFSALSMKMDFGQCSLQMWALQC